MCETGEAFINPDRLDMLGLEGFTLTYAVPWPLVLVVDRKAHFSYQMIFRHLISVKFAEMMLRKLVHTAVVLAAYHA